MSTVEQILGDELRNFLHLDPDKPPLSRTDTGTQEQWARHGAEFRAKLDARGLMVRSK